MLEGIENWLILQKMQILSKKVRERVTVERLIS